MIVAKRRIAATRAILAPRRLLIRRNHSFMRASPRKTCTTICAEDEARHGAAFLGDRAQTSRGVAGVPASGRQAQIVGQTPGARKSFDRADPRGQGQAAVGPGAGDRGDDRRRLAFRLTLANLHFQFLQAACRIAPIGQELIQFQAVDRAQRQLRQPLSAPPAFAAPWSGIPAASCASAADAARG